MTNRTRTIARVVAPTRNGDSPIVRLIGTVDIDGNGTKHELVEVDPFILLDTGVIQKHKMPPFGAHPHRGHSVVTLLIQGRATSWDSFSSEASKQHDQENHVMIKAPASYWVDAGSGMFHDERSYITDESDPSQHMKIMQLWIGVSEKDRSRPPRVQHHDNLPTFQCMDSSNSNTVVGQGVYHVGPQTNIDTPHPIQVVHIQQKANTTYNCPIDPSFGGFVIAMNGKAHFGGTLAREDNTVLVLKNDEEEANFLEITTDKESGMEFLVATGERIREPWFKKLVASGAIITATEEEARALVPQVQDMSKKGKSEGGSFAPWGI